MLLCLRLCNGSSLLECRFLLLCSETRWSKTPGFLTYGQGRLYPPPSPLAQIPPNIIGHRSFMELDSSPKGNCKRRRREAAIAEDKKPLATRESGGVS